MKNKRLTFVVSLLAIYLIGAFCESKVTNSKKETVTVGFCSLSVTPHWTKFIKVSKKD